MDVVTINELIKEVIVDNEKRINCMEKGYLNGLMESNKTVAN